MDLRTVATLHLATTWFLVGLIWFVQVAHYPLFAQVGRDRFVAYERAYTPRVTRVVLPAMLLEVLLAAWLGWLAPPELRGWALLGLLALAVVWASTFLLQVPCHRVLAERPDPDTMQRLVRSNWLRTAAWTGRGAIALLVVLRT
jgi:hypothetical protein